MKNKQTYTVKYSTRVSFEITSTLSGAKRKASQFLCVGHKVVIYDENNNAVCFKDISLSDKEKWENI
jgi:hypothetical protein